MNQLSTLRREIDATLEQRADRIRSLVNVTRGCIIEIGRELIAAKAVCAHGAWLPWLRDEFGWNERTAQRYMEVGEAFKYETVSDLTIDASPKQYRLLAQVLGSPITDGTKTYQPMAEVDTRAAEANLAIAAAVDRTLRYFVAADTPAVAAIVAAQTPHQRGVSARMAAEAMAWLRASIGAGQ